MRREDLGPEECEIYDLSVSLSKAIVANDAEAIGRFMTDEWLMLLERGVSTKEHFHSFIASGQLNHESMDLAELHSIRILGDTAIMAARITNVAHFGGMMFEADEWTSDVLVKRNGTWKCTMTHITPAVDIKKT